MQKIKFLVLGLSLFSWAGAAVELHQASNQQLLSELSFRLHSSQPTVTATAIYTCDSSGYLKIDLFSSTGSVKSQSRYLGSNQACLAQTPLLNANRSKVHSFMIAAVCDSSAYLYRYPLRTDGTYGEVTNIYVGDDKQCLDQAKVINSN